MPDYECVTIFHMRDIVAGKRRWIKADDMKHITIPHFEGLTVEKMLEYAAGRNEVMDYLPIVKRETEKLPRQYIANVIYTIVGQPFKQWVTEKVDERHEQRR